MLKEEVIESIRSLIGSNGEKGWPVAVKDRIAFANKDDSNFAVTFLWTMRDSVFPFLDKDNLALASNFYTPSGLVGFIRNILGNPFIRYVIMLGEEYSSKSADAAGGKNVSELTSANALRKFFEKGINADRKLEGFENAVYVDKNIPLELIEEIRKNVEFIDLNRLMPNASLDEKIKEANKLMKRERKENFTIPRTFDYEKAMESFPYEGGPILVHGSNIPDAWIKMIYNIYRYGRKNLMNANTDRWVKEINNMSVVIHNPQDMDLSINPFLVPLTIEKIEAYKKEILSPILPEGKAYTYGNKLRAFNYSAEEIKKIISSKEYKDFEFKNDVYDKNVCYKETCCEINQIADIIDVLKRDPYSKACVAITWHVGDELMRKHKSSPCLVFLQTMIQDEKLNLTVFFRSHDMTQGWPENAYGCAAIQAEIAKEIGVEPGILTIISGSAQIYNNYYQQVEQMLEKYYKPETKYQDARGNYLIKIENNEIIVTLTHPETGQELESFKGKTALELRDKIAFKTQLDTGHAIYLGAELMRAETWIKNNRSFEQDNF